MLEDLKRIQLELDEAQDLTSAAYIQMVIDRLEQKIDESQLNSDPDRLSTKA